MPKIGEELTEQLLTVEAYREAAFANGIPFRPNGLFTMGDSLLAELSKDPGLRAFQKNVVGFDEDGEPKYVPADWLPRDGAANGVDLRCFYRPDARTVVAAFRLGHRVSPTTCTRPHTEVRSRRCSTRRQPRSSSAPT